MVQCNYCLFFVFLFLSVFWFAYLHQQWFVAYVLKPRNRVINAPVVYFRYVYCCTNHLTLPFIILLCISTVSDNLILLGARKQNFILQRKLCNICLRNWQQRLQKRTTNLRKHWKMKKLIPQNLKGRMRTSWHNWRSWKYLSIKLKQKWKYCWNTTR